MSTTVLFAFALAVLPLSVTPGVSSTLVMTRVLAGGRAEGAKVALGTATGLYVHATSAAAGLAALVMASSVAFTALKVAGAGYLIALGVITFRSAGDTAPRELPWTGHGAYPQALLGNVLNPKAAVVYLTLMPQFVDPSAPVVPQIYLLATVHVVVAVAYLNLLAVVVAAAGVMLRTPTWRSLTQRLSGAVLALLGVRTAAQLR